HVNEEKTFRWQLAQFYLDAFEIWVYYDPYDQWEASRQKLNDAVRVITEHCGDSHRDLAKAYGQLALVDLIQGGNQLVEVEKKLSRAYRLYEQWPQMAADALTTLTKLTQVCQYFKEGVHALGCADNLY